MQFKFGNLPAQFQNQFRREQVKAGSTAGGKPRKAIGRKLQDLASQRLSQGKQIAGQRPMPGKDTQFAHTPTPSQMLLLHCSTVRKKRQKKLPCGGILDKSAGFCLKKPLFFSQE
jgi:hypothetical protein